MKNERINGKNAMTNAEYSAKYIHIIFLALLLIIFLKNDLHSQTKKKHRLPGTTEKSDSLIIAPKDSLMTADSLNQISDTTAAADTTIKKDTIPLYTPLYTHGSISLTPMTKFRNIRKEDLLKVNYVSISEILNKKLPIYPLSLDGHILYNHFSIMGAAPTNTAFTFNGRTLNDPEFGTLNPEQIPPEFLESAEILVGSDAVIFGDNSSGALINIQEIRYNTGQPYTRMWLGEAGYKFLGVDGIYSQNFKKNWNFNFGFRRLAGDNRFENSAADNWNVRGILRWNPSNRTSISFVENFTNFGMGLNGGVDETATPSEFYCDEIRAQTLYTTMAERIFRHDMTMTFSHYLAEDSISAVSGTLYLTRTYWDRDRSEGILFAEPKAETNYSYINFFTGATGKYEQNITKYFNLNAGGEINYNEIPSSPYTDEWFGINMTGFGRLEIDNLLPHTKLSGGIRLGALYGQIKNSFGAKAIFNITDSFLITADVSRSERIPSLSEIKTANKENNTLFYLDAKLNKKYFSINGGIFTRLVGSPILHDTLQNDRGTVIGTRAYNGDSRKALGAYFGLSWKILKHFKILPVYDDGNLNIAFKGQTNLTFTDEERDYRLPLLFGNLEIFYQGLAGHSLMNIGISTSVTTIFEGERYIPSSRAYVPYYIRDNFSFNGIDIFAELKLGNAYLRLMLENALSQCYYYVPIYPQFDRNIRLMVSWSFFE